MGRTHRVKGYLLRKHAGNREAPKKHIQNFRIDGAIDSRNDLNVASVKADLPFVRRRDHDIPINEFAPLHMIAEGSRKQRDTISELKKDLVCFLEDCDAAQFEIAVINCNVFKLRLCL